MNEAIKQPPLRISDLKLSFPDRADRLFDGIDLTVNDGEIVVILGGSGTGKSTLAELVFNLSELEPESGEIARASNSVLLLQEGAVFDHLTVRGNLKLVLSRMSRATDNESIRSQLDRVNLNTVALNQPAHALSGGQKRRLAVARALATEPKLLYFDEPSAGLDIDNVRDQAALICELCGQEERSGVIVTHDPLLAAMTADRVVILGGGRLTPLLEFDKRVDIADVDAIDRRQRQIEGAVEGRLKASGTASLKDKPGLSLTLQRHALKVFDAVLLPGDIFLELLCIGRRAFFSVRHVFDFLQIFWRSLWMAGISGLPFYGLIGFIIGTIIMVVLKLSSPLPFGHTMELVQGSPLIALTPPLMGFLFVARSGSALTAWLGGMVYSRQIDALRTLNISPDDYLRVPVWLGAFLSFVLGSLCFLLAMWFGAGTIATHVFLAENAYDVLNPLAARSTELSHAMVKAPIYGMMLGAVITVVGLAPKKTSEAVARGITRAIILGTVIVTVAELLARIPELAG